MIFFFFFLATTKLLNWQIDLSRSTLHGTLPWERSSALTAFFHSVAKHEIWQRKYPDLLNSVVGWTLHVWETTRWPQSLLNPGTRLDFYGTWIMMLHFKKCEGALKILVFYQVFLRRVKRIFPTYIHERVQKAWEEDKGNSFCLYFISILKHDLRF